MSISKSGSEHDPETAGALLVRFGAAIGGRDWPTMRRLLADDAVVAELHTGERFDADGFVAFNRDYPGEWVFDSDEVVDAGGRAVLRAHTDVGGQTYHVATFASASEGRLTDVVEVWTEAVAPHPERGTP